jgi:beta-glucosidase
MAEYCDIIRQKHVAVGLRAALHPQVDLATQYLWSRISGSLGEDADLTSRLVTAYVRGLQGDEITSTSVSACVKHFPGGGPQRDGFDCHMSASYKTLPTF